MLQTYSIMKMPKACFLYALFYLELCGCFILTPLNSTSIKPTKTGYSDITTASSRNITAVPTMVPHRDYQQLLDILMDERRMRIQLENQIEDLEKNISLVLANVEEVLVNRTDLIESESNMIEIKLQDTSNFLERNISDLSAVYENLELKCNNLSDIYKDISARNGDLENKIQNLTVNSVIDHNKLLQLSEKEGRRSGFTVSSPKNAASSGMITFQKLISNIGDHYNLTTGEFTCEYSGIYFFTLSLYKDGLADFAYCSIRHNGTDVIEAYSNPNTIGDYGFYSSGTSLLLHLDTGDTVDLGHCTDDGTINYRTVFAGFLLAAD